jgi:hypothetical protein
VYIIPCAWEQGGRRRDGPRATAHHGRHSVKEEEREEADHRPPRLTRGGPFGRLHAELSSVISLCCEFA